MTDELTDHQRGCAGRDYTCTCDYDDAVDRLSRWQKGFNSGVEEAAKALEADAKLCDCAAREERECGCGAWCEWKSITSARAVEIVRALQELG
jgi:hypothetical protein